MPSISCPCLLSGSPIPVKHLRRHSTKSATSPFTGDPRATNRRLRQLCRRKPLNLLCYIASFVSSTFVQFCAKLRNNNSLKSTDRHRVIARAKKRCSVNCILFTATMIQNPLIIAKCKCQSSSADEFIWSVARTSPRLSSAFYFLI